MKYPDAKLPGGKRKKGLTMKNFNNRAKATIAMIASLGLALSLMSCTSCDIKTGSPPVQESSTTGSAVPEASAVSAVSARFV